MDPTAALAAGMMAFMTCLLCDYNMIIKYTELSM